MSECVLTEGSLFARASVLHQGLPKMAGTQNSGSEHCAAGLLSFSFSSGGVCSGPNQKEDLILEQCADILRLYLARPRNMIAQTCQPLPVSLRFHQLVPSSAPSVAAPAHLDTSSGHTISVDVRIGASAARSIAFRNGLEQTYALGVGVPHARRPVHAEFTSLAALPASLPVPTGEESREETLKMLPRKTEGVADDPSLHNPLARLERLSTGWFGVSPPLSAGLDR
jgi:hypothetical protein